LLMVGPALLTMACAGASLGLHRRKTPA